MAERAVPDNGGRHLRWRAGLGGPYITTYVSTSMFNLDRARGRDIHVDAIFDAISPPAKENNWEVESVKASGETRWESTCIHTEGVFCSVFFFLWFYPIGRHVLSVDFLPPNSPLGTFYGTFSSGVALSRWDIFPSFFCPSRCATTYIPVGP